MRTARPTRSLAVLLAASSVCAGLAACSSPVELRQQVIALDGSWRVGKMEPGSFEQMLDDLRALAAQSPDDPNRIAGLPDVLRLALGNPSSLVRAEALRTAWALGSGLPVPTEWRQDPLDREDFNRRTSRIEELVGGDQALSEEALGLARWLASYRVVADDVDHARLSVSIAEVVLSQGLWRQDDLGAAFREGLEGSAAHALDLVTLQASRDTESVVREEALAHADRLPADLAVILFRDLLAREKDSAVVLAALDGIGRADEHLPAEARQALLQPLAESTDVAVRLRVAGLLQASAAE